VIFCPCGAQARQVARSPGESVLLLEFAFTEVTESTDQSAAVEGGTHQFLPGAFLVVVQHIQDFVDSLFFSFVEFCLYFLEAFLHVLEGFRIELPLAEAAALAESQIGHQFPSFGLEITDDPFDRRFLTVGEFECLDDFRIGKSVDPEQLALDLLEAVDLIFVEDVTQLFVSFVVDCSRGLLQFGLVFVGKFAKAETATTFAELEFDAMFLADFRCGLEKLFGPFVDFGDLLFRHFQFFLDRLVDDQKVGSSTAPEAEHTRLSLDYRKHGGSQQTSYPVPCAHNLPPAWGVTLRETTSRPHPEAWEHSVVYIPDGEKIVRRKLLDQFIRKRPPLRDGWVWSGQDSEESEPHWEEESEQAE